LKTIKTLNVCLLGQPNVGKSTLLNKLINKKTSIVSRKQQTTLKKYIGVYHRLDKQIVIFDTPGVFSNKQKVKRQTFKEASNAISEADLIVVVVSIKKQDQLDFLRTLIFIKEFKKEFIVVLNKIDLYKSGSIISITKKIKIQFQTTNIFRVSSKNGKGIEKLRSFFEDSKLSKYRNYIKNKVDKKNKEYLEQIVREKLLNNIHDEIPYNLEIVAEDITIKRDGSVKAYVNIELKKKSYKPILIGKEGKTIKTIGSQARLELEKTFEVKYHLFLRIIS
tara:strand:+ start:1955 stop:2788 length:834 start_codon:yes stop_codon:yes gene_type:complete